MNEMLSDKKVSSDSDLQDFKQSFRAIALHRSSIYAWFSDCIALEHSAENLASYNEPSATVLWRALGFCGLQNEATRLQSALLQLSGMPDAQLELAADFASAFLLSAEACATPYASWYLEADKRMYGKPAAHMKAFLAENHLQLDSKFREPADHLAVFLGFLSHWVETSATTPIESVSEVALLQGDFIQTALLSWVPLWAGRCQSLSLKTDVYPAFASLLSAFLAADVEYLSEVR
ncbi:molecular chaperone TorD [Neisseria iguanae]|uniref:Molecular chaperone TorD n=1 Tax=Neisseria iguanae TaxID=90242 RepID=A0A2P7U0E8_9NEIS|nr:molecular chaperone TorD [Neisseria iguanae]PSJ80446.1 molecular chaperone TorD [Neisseria iguanae]